MNGIYEQILRTSDLCFDIGAHAGTKTKQMLEHGVRVIAVEPQPHWSEKLRRQFPQPGPVEVVDAAVGPRHDIGMLSICEQADTISTLSAEWRARSRFAIRGYRWERQQPVTIVTLDELISRHGRPAFCKLDIEGFEAEALAGLSVPIHFVAFEFTEEFPDSIIRCLKVLSNLSLISCNVSIGEADIFAFKEWRNPATIMEDLERLKDTNSCEWGLCGDVYVQMEGASLDLISP